MLESAARSLQTILEDIATNVRIQGEVEIVHPDDPVVDLPVEFTSRIKSLPIELQRKYLALQLRNFLYSVYYNGSAKAGKSIEPQAATKIAPAWANDTFLGIDWQFYQQLQAHNYGTGYFDRDWQVMGAEADNTLVVKKKGLTIYIDRQIHLRPIEISAIVGDLVDVKMPHNLVQNGFYVAVSNAGGYDFALQGTARTLVRVYFHLTPTGAVAVMESLTQLLNTSDIPFQFKVLSNPNDYNRYDTGVLYIHRYYYPAVAIVLGQTYRKHQQYFKPETPLFTKPIALGLAVAEEPDRQFAESESFGMNRCQIVADGLISAHLQGDLDPQLKLLAIKRSFDRVGIDLTAPFLNPGSVDIYAKLT